MPYLPIDLPDAPWVRDAEVNGMPDCDDVGCPVCGEAAETFFVIDGEVIGCENCVDRVDAYEWKENHDA